MHLWGRQPDELHACVCKFISPARYKDFARG